MEKADILSYYCFLVEKYEKFEIEVIFIPLETYGSF